ncbi:PQQ-binding-like beta-propeller repeat protein [Mariniblastus sp.]|nr:PQQ-binding-like beta-propeller repeat protein [Mariniblastus sp.]MDB4756465.1 PQQ-binding-like beta-propeller repeat protein [Mariniblastus sp.]
MKACHIFFLSLVFAMIFHHASGADDWTNFRGPGGQGYSTEKNLPTQWGDEENLAWKVKLPGAGSSSPIALGEKLYLTCYSGYGINRGEGSLDALKLHLVCVNSQDGSVEWDTKINSSQPESDRVRDHGYAAATPATDGKNIYVFFGKTGVVKFDLNGKKIWQTSVGDGVHGWGCGTSPVLYQNLVIVNASVESGSVVAIDKESGEEKWRVESMNRSWSTPHLVAVGGKQELVVNSKDEILAYNPATGENLWSCKGIPDYVCPSIVSHQGVVYVLGGRSSMTVAVKAGGKGEVSEIWRARVGANVTSPVVYQDHLYWVSDRNTTAYCLKLSDGEVVYQKRVASQPYASSVIADGKIYVVTRRAGTIVLAAKPDFEELAQNKLTDGTQFNASPIVSGGKIYLRSDKNLYCVAKGSR